MAKSRGIRPRGSLEERFWRKVDRSGGPDACWPWLGYRLPAGYGQIGEGPAGGRHLYAHRVSYALNVGPIPPGHFVCHHCDNPPCVNPAHLFTAPPVSNTADMVRKGRDRRRPSPGALNGRAKLTARQVETIRASERAPRELMSEFGISKSTLYRVLRGESWTLEDAS